MLLKQAYHKLRDDGQADQQVIQDLEEENQRLRKMVRSIAHEILELCP
jgi:protease II